MKRLSVSLLLIGSLSFAPVAGFSALASPLSGKVFKNCTELRKTYPGGVAKSKSSRNVGGATKKTPRVDAKVYAANKKMDRDGDGIACEN